MLAGAASASRRRAPATNAFTRCADAFAFGSSGFTGRGARPSACGSVSESRPESPPALPRPRRTRTKRSEEHTFELQSRSDLVCRLLLEKKKKPNRHHCWRSAQTARQIHTLLG